ncbi:hypothetical protein SLS57_012472 [Botryosphaeria dothidea]
MASQPIPKYHIAPNFSIPPVEAGGILDLGSIIADIGSADEPCNERCHLRIPLANLFCGHQKGFTATRSRLTSGEYGVWAKVVGIDGIGGKLSIASEQSAEDVYSFDGVDTIYFNPSQKYMEESMNQQDVKNFVIGSGYDPVYMVTGLKTARGPSVRISKSRKLGGTAEVGLQIPGGLPIELGPKFSTAKERMQQIGFEYSTDFIIGIRVKKLMYKKHWLTRAPKELVAKEHNKGATMVDDDVLKKGYDNVVDFGDDAECGIEIEMETIDAEDGGTETLAMAWVLH